MVTYGLFIYIHLDQRFTRKCTNSCSVFDMYYVETVFLTDADQVNNGERWKKLLRACLP